MSVSRRDGLLFLLACAALVAGAVGFAGRPSAPRVPSGTRASFPPPAGLKAPETQLVARTHRLAARLRRSARRFIGAFLRYEVGETDGRTLADLRAHATPGFARDLLSRPARAALGRRFPPAAELGRLQLAFLSAAARRALVSGSAHRGGSREPVSFVFVRRGSLWLANGPGQ